MIYGYARVSTKKQLEGNGLEVQEKAMLAAGADMVINGTGRLSFSNLPCTKRKSAGVLTLKNTSLSASSTNLCGTCSIT